jgi:hypothetical protein
MSVSTLSAVESICLSIAQLDTVSRQEVFKRIEQMRNETPPPSPGTDKKVRISDLWGVGAEMWREAGGADEYIRKERESWEGREATWS